MKTKLLLVIAGLGLTLGSVQQARATADTNKLTIALSFIAQGATTTKTNSSSGAITYTTRLDKFRGTDKDLISILGDAVGQSFPLGSYLGIDGDIFDPPSVNFLVKDKTGAVLANVTAYFTIQVTSDDIYSDVWNDTTFAETSQDNYMVRLTFDDHAGNTFDVSGLASESFKATPINANDEQTLTSSITIAVSGTATSGTDTAVVKGTVTVKGKSISD